MVNPNRFRVHPKHPSLVSTKVQVSDLRRARIGGKYLDCTSEAPFLNWRGASTRLVKVATFADNDTDQA
jgi:hypothetical protein